MKYSTATATTTALAALAFGLQAQATTVDLGEISAGESHGASLSIGMSDVAVNDSWLFTLTEDVMAAIVFDSADFESFFGIADFRVSSNSEVIEFESATVDENRYTFAGVLPAGTYELAVTGQTSGMFGGQYEMSIGAAEMAAVPVPAAAWLLGSGLMAAFISRRRPRASEG